MGSYGKLARRALETEMPVMVQVFRLESQVGSVFALNRCFPVQLASGSVHCVCCGKSLMLLVVKKWGFGFCRYRNWSGEPKMQCLWPRFYF